MYITVYISPNASKRMISHLLIFLSWGMGFGLGECHYPSVQKQIPSPRAERSSTFKTFKPSKKVLTTKRKNTMFENLLSDFCGFLSKEIALILFWKEFFFAIFCPPSFPSSKPFQKYSQKVSPSFEPFFETLSPPPGKMSPPYVGEQKSNLGLQGGEYST